MMLGDADTDYYRGAFRPHSGGVPQRETEERP
jgi:hypothetical protein